ncbi:hypothetical protein BV911_12880 [Pseudoruegeria sp. SK021]|nr:hypothetical protein BV911_12880 [Pseudoruegeria sp. SK021]
MRRGVLVKAFDPLNAAAVGFRRADITFLFGRNGASFCARSHFDTQYLQPPREAFSTNRDLGAHCKTCAVRMRETSPIFHVVASVLQFFRNFRTSLKLIHHNIRRT